MTQRLELDSSGSLLYLNDWPADLLLLENETVSVTTWLNTEDGYDLTDESGNTLMLEDESKGNVRLRM